MSPSSSNDEDDHSSTSDPKRLKSMAVRPPSRQPSSTCKNPTMNDGLISHPSVPNTSSKNLPWSYSPVTSSHSDYEHKDQCHGQGHGHGHGHGHGGDEHPSPLVAHENLSCIASKPHFFLLLQRASQETQSSSSMGPLPGTHGPH